MSSSRWDSKPGNCGQNPKCCYESHDLECPNKFNPPLLSTPTEFCTEVLAKGIPIPKCTLAKPKRLVIEKEPPPLAKPTSSRHLKNWQRWCYIWRQTYNTITKKRNFETRPPVMTSGEVHRLKKEDKELFDRTLHSYHMNGFYVKNTVKPDSIRPKPCGGDQDITEVITKRHLREFPEMKRHRYPTYVRNETSLAPRKAVKGSRGGPGIYSGSTSLSSSKGNPQGFNWEESWAKTKDVEEAKGRLACDIGLYGKPDPIPDNLIFKPALSKDGHAERIIYEKKQNKKGDITVPQLIFSADAGNSDDRGSPESVSVGGYDDKNSGQYYVVQRGPILRIRSESREILMSFSKSYADIPHFISDPSAVINTATTMQYFCDENHHFSVTTKCKDMKFITLKNEGTTAIRYQWFRTPPNLDSQKMLQDPTHFKHLRVSQSLDRGDKTEENVFELDSKDAVFNNVCKTPHLEFHFSELPGVILPGQALEFPIIFRSKTTGYFHETIYLLTHPRMNTPDGRFYSVGLSGICTDIDLAEKGNEMHEVDGLKRYLSDHELEEESVDLMDAILDRALWGVTNNDPLISSLPNGRITAEGVFYAHNKDFYYYFGKAEHALELTRQLTDKLVPKERKSECELSIQILYNLVMSARKEGDLNWEFMRKCETEDLLREISSLTRTIIEPRIFAWPSTERRKYVACYSNMLVTFDEILLGFDRLRNFYDSDIIKRIDQRKGEELIMNYLRKNSGAQEYYLEEEEFEGEGAESLGGPGGEIGDTGSSSGKMPPLTDPIESSIDPFTSVSEDTTNKNTAVGTGTATTAAAGTVMGTAVSEDTTNNQAAGSYVTESTLIDMMMAPGMNTAEQEGEGEDEGEGFNIFKKKPTVDREHTCLTLEETMFKRAGDERRAVVTEARVKLFEELLCEGIERMLSTVDSFNNMLDYRSSDAVVCLDDVC